MYERDGQHHFLTKALGQGSTGNMIVRSESLLKRLKDLNFRSTAFFENADSALVIARPLRYVLTAL